MNCHYFVLPQRVEDRVLDVLVRKTETIKQELGSLPKAIEDTVEQRLTRYGIRHHDAENLRRKVEAESVDQAHASVSDEELEAARDRRHDLQDQIERCRRLLQKSRSWVRFSPEPFHQAIDCSLELLGAPPLVESTQVQGGGASSSLEVP